VAPADSAEAEVGGSGAHLAERFEQGAQEVGLGGNELRSEPASTAEAAAEAARAAAAASARLKEEELKRRSLEEDTVGGGPLPAPCAPSL
jgi:hypothetical protein